MKYDPTKPIGNAKHAAKEGEWVAIVLNENGRAMFEELYGVNPCGEVTLSDREGNDAQD